MKSLNTMFIEYPLVGAATMMGGDGSPRDFDDLDEGFYPPEATLKEPANDVEPVSPFMPLWAAK
ncbi:MAG: hypothetical protein AAFV62_07870 [Pseudomonadota bacterium]